MSPKKRAKTSDSDRKKLVEYVFNHDLSVAEACRLLGLKKRTGYDIATVYCKEKRIAAKKSSGRPKKFDESFESGIISFIQSKPDATLKELQQHLADHPLIYGGTASLSTINRIISKHKFSLKVLSKVPAARNTPRTISLRYDYIGRLLALSNKRKFYIDEMGCNMHTRRRFGRSKIGEPATITTPTQRGNNVSICACIGIDGVKHYRVKHLAYNTLEFIAFLDELYAKIDDPTDAVFIMDNARFHHARLVVDWFNDKRLTQEFVPPYSPMLNPIEECFSKIHQSICMARVSSERTLFSAIDDAFASVTASNCRGWFDHTIEYHGQCLRKQPILTKANQFCPDFEIEEVLEEEEDEDDESILSQDEIAMVR